jgi:uncharacterized protein
MEVMMEDYNIFMKKVLAILFLIIIAGSVSFYFYKNRSVEKVITPVVKNNLPKPFDKYSYESLRKTNFSGDKIIIDKLLKDDPKFSSYLFYFFDNGKKVSGILNLPKAAGTFPVIVMARGFIDPVQYATGDGTRHAGEVLAANGFIALAPDFLGYGSSDAPSKDAFEDRFLTYTSELSLLASIKNLNQALAASNIKNIVADPEKIGLWGHSNGGQITLTVLEITGKNYPTVLWAPVSKPFPYSILYYTDDIDDHGKLLRRVLANFEKDYDAEKYSLINYLSWIKAPIQLSQGGGDTEVPQRWSDDFVSQLKKNKVAVDYFIYPGDDHNFFQGSWNKVVEKNIEFFKKELK